MSQRQAILPQFNDERITDPKHRLNEGKLFIAIKELPEKAKQELMSMTWEELFELAAGAESIKKHMPSFDIAFQKFVSDEHQFLKLAELVQIRQSYIHQLAET